jgi:signal transduction histidine kinase/ActR/RegA family two-component response regulator
LSFLRTNPAVTFQAESTPGAVGPTSPRALARAVLPILIVAIAALPIVPLFAITGWVVAALVQVCLGAIIRTTSSSGGLEEPRGWFVVELLGGVINAVAAVMFWQSDSLVAKLFALVIVFGGILQNFTANYPRAKLLLLLALPRASVVLIGASFLVNRELADRNPQLTITTALAVPYMLYFLFATRAALAKSRADLLSARAEAQERTQAAEEANLAKSSFLATMSHEIRTPLNGVLGMAQAVLGDDLPAQQRGRVEVIRQSGLTLLILLNDILDLSKIAAGKLDLENIEFDLSALLLDCRASFQALADAKALDFLVEIMPEARGIYYGDPTRVRQILNNLVSNAVKFTKQGQVSVRADRSGEALQIAVEDTGIGMSAKVLPQLFERFAQADVSTTRQFGGTGLGLAICKELAELLGGRIEVESREGKGTTFLVILELAKVDEERTELERPHAAIIAIDNLNVLVAEDNSVNQLVIRTLLNQVGIEPVVVADGEQAVSAWRRQTFDVILMDVQMPVMDGLSAVKAIRALEMELQRPATPVIALTANAMAHQVREYRACGIDACVAKPININELFATMDLVIAAGSPKESEP